MKYIFHFQSERPECHRKRNTAHLHESRQVGVVIIQGGNDVKFNLDRDSVA